ncbi:TraX family protein [Halomonas halocynthiae]|uniref:TraX family protein n=1 Tax=Halomonas halocynthiae TaxID=176290 RepID=UPI00047FDCE8|nr:TraX family protein [Halomonas halocynthiae]
MSSPAPLQTFARPLPLTRPCSNWAGWGQWLALITMTLDHLARYVAPEAWQVSWLGSSVGRIAFPLFAGMVAWHACFNTRDPLRYARRILVIGLVAQLPYMLMPRSSDALIINICFTLSLGLVGGVWLSKLGQRLRQKRARIWRLGAEVTAAVIVWWLAGSLTEYGHLGLLLIPSYMVAMQHLHGSDMSRSRITIAALSCVPVLIISGLMNTSLMAKSFTLGTCAVVLLLTAGLHRHIPTVVIPMPRRLWLSWYPGHFAAIALWLFIISRM